MSDLVERLNDEAMRLQGRGIDRGCVDSSLAGNLALEAADTIERLEAEKCRLNERLVETQMLAFKWMEAHDKLHAGKPYDFPSPADVPRLEAEKRMLVAKMEAVESLIGERKYASALLEARSARSALERTQCD